MGERGGRPANLKPHKPGVPQGHRALIGRDPAQMALRRFGKKEFTRILDLVLTSTVEDLKNVIKDPERSALTKSVAAALLKASVKGDWKTIDGIVERIVHKVIRHDHTSKGDKLPSGNSEPRVVMYIPSNGRTKEENESDDGAGF